LDCGNLQGVFEIITKAEDRGFEEKSYRGPNAKKVEI
jgi:hypothetical protein